MAGVLWSTGPAGDPHAVGHRMVSHSHGRVGSPLCGCSSDGLWLRAHTTWGQVPAGQRCPQCAAHAPSYSLTPSMPGPMIDGTPALPLRR